MQSLSELGPAVRHRAVAAEFTTRVGAVVAWDAPTPVDDWVARDVVAHLVDWFTDFLAAGDVTLPRGPSVVDDPIGAWAAHADAVQSLLDGPSADESFSHPYVGAHRLADAVDRFYTADGFAAALVDGMAEMDEVLRSSAQYGAAVDVAAAADPVTRMVGFIGRDPAWVPS
ncbi:hypothetical protein [Gordonia soli]|uniref:Mycothiol-dependent maleylpyruvate isomerase metal-binding domain-containing protein n=1 Tax=Gordonia soli NBRC 108243 TaxID=1223545 RepID=M0QPC8_9ACTN|nr:hypothetical protein GS4_34_00890 [Gordonia soli NBRC 108243]